MTFQRALDSELTPKLAFLDMWDLMARRGNHDMNRYCDASSASGDEESTRGQSLEEERGLKQFTQLDKHCDGKSRARGPKRPRKSAETRCRRRCIALNNKVRVQGLRVL